MFKDRNRILNPKLVASIAKLGHFDLIAVVDAGMPLPYKKKNIEIIDLSFYPGVPSFSDVFKKVLEELEYQRIYVAPETEEINPVIYKTILDNANREITFVSNHDELKELLTKTMLIIRTSETSPYANAIIECGVNF
ncbi:D-ribose pyranase [Mycoplasmopsis agassizii]|uniref:D-ribose pyranase n=1 Tax=Mycoplasmopsis agassizii TaxID=33922 RepID=A0A1W1X3Y3_9BACT|nr:D-ribose pyranase [Mycoplasmopsis agassizii]PAF54833.1 D-ribose pyranase [Mycoplasmopsis agassizii]PAK21149.1 D-ribose pyranase [Mycoplasmopsis agassizii]SMC18636.1 D-ribose pyranase [Mycoplasmopsis agassizii]